MGFCDLMRVCVRLDEIEIEECRVLIEYLIAKGFDKVPPPSPSSSRPPSPERCLCCSSECCGGGDRGKVREVPALPPAPCLCHHLRNKHSIHLPVWNPEEADSSCRGVWSKGSPFAMPRRERETTGYEPFDHGSETLAVSRAEIAGSGV